MNSGFEALSWDLRNENLFKTEALFLARKNDWSALFIEHFLSVCADIVKLQSESSLPAISRIQYTMLNNDFIDRRYVSEVWGSDNAMYLDKKKCMVGEFDISFLFVYFNEMWDKLLSPRKRCKATDQEVVSFMSESLPHFYSYLISIARFAIAECVDKKPFVDIAKEDFFKVNVDDYMSETAETVYMEKKNKNAEDLSKWFSEKINYAYNHGDYSGLDFSGKEFINTDFRYVRFRDSKLNYVNFENSSLIGASFRNAEMEGCRLDNCYIFEADFSNANMKNASLIQTTGKVGSIDKKVWQFVGYLPVNFHNADLTGADFTGAKLTGADFTGAILSGADFTTRG